MWSVISGIAIPVIALIWSAATLSRDLTNNAAIFAEYRRVEEMRQADETAERREQTKIIAGMSDLLNHLDAKFNVILSGEHDRPEHHSR